jgi:aminoglycoside phosphotransferase
MKAHPLPGLDQWDDFDRAAVILAKPLGWMETQRVDGPDARVCSFNKDHLHLWLVYDDMMGMALKCDGDASHLAEVGRELLAVLKPLHT